MTKKTLVRRPASNQQTSVKLDGLTLCVGLLTHAAKLTLTYEPPPEQPADHKNDHA